MFIAQKNVYREQRNVYISTAIPCTKLQVYILVCCLFIALYGFSINDILWAITPICNTKTFIPPSNTCTKFHLLKLSLSQTDGQLVSSWSFWYIYDTISISISFRCYKQTLGEENCYTQLKYVARIKKSLPHTHEYVYRSPSMFFFLLRKSCMCLSWVRYRGNMLFHSRPKNFGVDFDWKHVPRCCY